MNENSESVADDNLNDSFESLIADICRETSEEPDEHAHVLADNSEELSSNTLEQSESVEEKHDLKMLEDYMEPTISILSDEETDKNYNLTEFFYGLLQKTINYQITNEETKDIIKSIDILVETVVSMVTTKVAWLPFSRLLKVGSIAEETSIQFPDEFDYLVVLHVNPDAIEVERKCQERRGYIHAKITDSKLGLLWGKWMEDKYLKSDFTRADTDMFSGYFETLGNAFKSEVQEITDINSMDLVHVTNTGIMKICPNSMSNHGPAFTQTFNWEPIARKETITIKVDITPAIEIDLSPDIISIEDTYDKTFFSKLKDNGKYMIVSSHNNASCRLRQCFLLTFTETEVELVRSLSEHHKQSYKILKYVFSSGDGYAFLPSYVWKTLVLKHSCHCECLSLAGCFKTVVASCLHYLFNRRTTEERIEMTRIARLFMPGQKFGLHIPSIFFKEHNILDSKDNDFPCEQLLQEIEMMLQSLDDISSKKITETDYKKLKIVNSLKTGPAAYAMSIPLPRFISGFIENKGLIKCLECYQNYFDEHIL